MKRLNLIACIVIATLTLSCKNNKNAVDGEIDSKAIVDLKNNGTENEYFAPDSTVVPPPGEKKQIQQQPEPAKQDWDKKIIKTGSLNLEVTEYKKYYTSLREKVKNLGGYIAQEEQNQSDYKIENVLSIKIPVDQFDNAIAQLSQDAQKIDEKKIASADVTAEFVDTKSRMEAKKQVRERYIDLLKQAKNMEEILSVQAEINAVQEQIEAGMGRMTYLGHSAVFSTIHLTYYQIINSSAKDSAKPSFAARFSNAFKTGWSWISELAIGLISIWPLFLVFFVSFILYKKVKNRKLKPVIK